MNSPQAPAPRRRRWRRLLAIVVIFLLGLAVATISTKPTVAPLPYPGAGDALHARQLLEQLRAVQASGQPTPIAASQAQLRSTAAVAGETFGYDRIALRLQRDHLAFSASLPLRWGTWLNIDGRVEPSHAGFPAIPARIGWLPLPAPMTRFALNLARRWAADRGDALPALDTLVRAVRFDGRNVLATVYLPPGGAIQRLANGLRPDPIDPAVVARVYCALAEAERTDPAKAWSEQVRRAFAKTSTSQDNRAAMVALAMLAVGPEAGNLAGDASQRVSGCAIPPPRFLLLQRPDLPKHWALSAALTAAYGDTVSTRIGVWKEVADSAPGGSGFSFVDLAADRSGIVYARSASNPASAMKTARFLAQIEEHDLLPVNALALAEGISEAQYLQRYGKADTPEFEAARQRMDAILSDLPKR